VHFVVKGFLHNYRDLMTKPNLDVPILMYHRIGDRVKNSIVRDQYVPLDLFESQLATLRKAGYTTISLDEMRAGFQSGNPLGLKGLVITFDDGYESFFNLALPVLKRHGMKATVFLVANCVGHTNRWDEAKGDVTEPLMSWDQIRSAHADGTEFGAHSMNHPDLRFCDDDTAAEEVAGCKGAIEKQLGFTVNWYSYPYGKHLERDRRLAKEAGYFGATGTDKQTNNANTDPFCLGRLNVRATTFPAYLMYKLRKASGSHG